MLLGFIMHTVFEFIRSGKPDRGVAGGIVPLYPRKVKT